MDLNIVKLASIGAQQYCAEKQCIKSAHDQSKAKIVLNKIKKRINKLNE